MPPPTPPHFDTSHVDVSHLDVHADGASPVHVDIPVHIDGTTAHVDADAPVHIDGPGPHADLGNTHVDAHVDAPSAHVDLGELPDPAAFGGAITALAERIEAVGQQLLGLNVYLVQLQAMLASMQQAMNMATGAAMNVANGTLPSLVGLQSSMDALLRQYTELTEALGHDGRELRSRYELAAADMARAHEDAKAAADRVRDSLRAQIRAARDRL